jgi:hypothetical protein
MPMQTVNISFLFFLHKPDDGYILAKTLAGFV